MKRNSFLVFVSLLFLFVFIINSVPISVEGESLYVSSTDVFSDVKPGSWFKNSVDYVYSNGLMNGTSAKKFEPNTKMSRAMLVTVLWRYEGSPSNYSNNFNDIPAGTWYTDAVCWAGENGIVTGVAAGLFDPNGNITREQLVTIMYRYTQYMGCNDSASTRVNVFPDGSKVSDWAKKGMEWAIAESIISGTKDLKGTTILAPRDNATRAEVATVLMRYCSNGLYIHYWDEGRVNSEPTCTEKGEVVYVCMDCGIEKHVALSALGHIKTQRTVTKNPTCTTEGVASFYCTRCEKWNDEPIAKSDHKWNAATCTSPKTCSVCGKTSGSALGHQYQAATCTKPKTCKVCGATTGSALGHDWKNHVCSRCKAKEPAKVQKYILNPNSMVFHEQNCPSVKRMNPENKVEMTATRDEITALGYKPCKNCNP